jgi:hypothetical protein
LVDLLTIENTRHFNWNILEVYSGNKRTGEIFVLILMELTFFYLNPQDIVDNTILYEYMLGKPYKSLPLKLLKTTNLS